MTEEIRNQILHFSNSYDQFNIYNGLRVVDVDDGFCALEVELRPESLNTWGTPHGGLLFAMADVACGVSAVSVRLEQCVTASASIDYLDAALGGAGTLRAEARVLRAGRKLCYCAAEVRDGQGKLLIRLNTTMYYMGQKLPL